MSNARRFLAVDSAHRGFTVTELLVVLATIGIVLGILVPAVFAARARARLLHCQNSMKQLAIAGCQYVEVNRVFPNGTTTEWEGVRPACTPLTALLPFADSRYPVKYSEQIIAPAVIPLFLCPDDVVHHRSPRSFTYRVNAGSSVNSVLQADGPFGSFNWLGVNEVTDGLSQTAMISESIGIPRSQEMRPARAVTFRHFFVVNSALGQTAVDHNERAILSCEQKIGNFFPNPEEVVYDYSSGGVGTFSYHHALVPNLPVCTQPIILPVLTHNFLSFFRGASSEHPGGVNVAFADGHVKFISDSIDKAVWRAMGTRAGNDNANE